MPKKKKRGPSRDSVTQGLRGGKALPQKLVRECVSNLRRDRESLLDKRSSAERQMAKYLGRAQGGTQSDSGGAGADRAQAGLLRTHKKLARQKLAAPNVLGEFGPMLPGQISVTVVPPFDYDVIIPSTLAGNPHTLQGASNKNTGKMSLGAITDDQPGFNGGSMYTTVGLYFHPPARGILTLYAAPTYSFQWWTNSLRSTDIVRSFGQLGLTVYGVDLAGQTIGETGTIIDTAAEEFFSWDESQTGQVQLDFGFNEQTAVLSTELNVNRNFVYLLFVDANVHVYGVGWPGSLAGAKLSVSVPYLRYDFRVEQVVQPF